MKRLQSDDIRELVRLSIRTTASSGNSWARRHGIPDPSLWDYLRGRTKEPPQRILQALGLERVMYYQRKPTLRRRHSSPGGTDE